VIAPAKPRSLIWRGQQGLDFRPRWICAEWAGGLECRIPKEGMERGEAQIPTANAQAVLLHVIEKRHDERRVNLLEVQT
jgi:hypothetical protein